MDGQIPRKKWDDPPPLQEDLLRHAQRLLADFSWRRALRLYVFRVHTLLIILWIWLLQWGEVRVYDKDVSGCKYGQWERWVSIHDGSNKTKLMQLPA